MILKHQQDLKFPSMGFDWILSSRALILNTWSPVCEISLGISTALLEEVNHWQQAMRIHNLVPLPVVSVCSLVLVENVNSKLPALATCCHSATANTYSLPGTVSQKIYFWNKLLLVTMFYHNRKVTTAHESLLYPSECVSCRSSRLCWCCFSEKH